MPPRKYARTPKPAPRARRLRKPARRSPDELDAEVDRLFAAIERAAGAEVRTLAERSAARTLESFVRKMDHHLINRVGGISYSGHQLGKLLAAPELDRATLQAAHAILVERTRRFIDALARTREAVLGVRAHMCDEPLAPLVEDVRAAVVTALGDHAATFDFEAEVEEGLSADVDHPIFVRALAEVVKNAAEAYPPEVVRHAVRLTARARGRVVEIEVVDEGFGWDRETLRYALVPYGSGKPDGTGLGLYLARRAIEDWHGGAFVVESEGRRCGTRVRVRVPRRQEGVQPRRRLTEEEMLSAAEERAAKRAERLARRGR